VAVVVMVVFYYPAIGLFRYKYITVLQIVC